VGTLLLKNSGVILLPAARGNRRRRGAKENLAVYLLFFLPVCDCVSPQWQDGFIHIIFRPNIEEPTEYLIEKKFEFSLPSSTLSFLK
jgi:hypothetical protein